MPLTAANVQTFIGNNCDLRAGAAALQRQVIEHLGPIWDITAIVNAYRRLEDVPPHYWPLLVFDRTDGTAGIHEDDRGQPFALVAFGPSWSLAASHECLEMLVDPYGKALHVAPAPTLIGGLSPGDVPQVEFLVEVCDPCESEQFAYHIDGILVSDFYTPHYLSRQTTPGMQFSFNNQISAPREVLDGGYLSWRDPLSGRWGQITRVEGIAEFVDLGVLKIGGQSIRQETDRVGTPLRSPLRRRAGGRHDGCRSANPPLGRRGRPVASRGAALAIGRYAAATADLTATVRELLARTNRAYDQARAS
jgi:hypothetical protein